jgi:predicted oxidoreductase
VNLIGILDEISASRGVKRDIVTLAWLLKHPAGIMPVIGTSKLDRIREQARADEIELTREEWYRIFVAARMKKLP